MKKELALLAQTLLKEQFTELTRIISEFVTQEPLQFYQSQVQKLGIEIFFDDFAEFQQFVASKPTNQQFLKVFFCCWWLRNCD